MKVFNWRKNAPEKNSNAIERAIIRALIDHPVIGQDMPTSTAIILAREIASGTVDGIIFDDETGGEQ